jgi:hypothetical protein
MQSCVAARLNACILSKCSMRRPSCTGFGRLATETDFIQTSSTYDICRNLCTKVHDGRLVNAKTRFVRQLVYSLLKTAALARSGSLEESIMRAWAGAYMVRAG